MKVSINPSCCLPNSYCALVFESADSPFFVDDDLAPYWQLIAGEADLDTDTVSLDLSLGSDAQAIMLNTNLVDRSMTRFNMGVSAQTSGDTFSILMDVRSDDSPLDYYLELVAEMTDGAPALAIYEVVDGVRQLPPLRRKKNNDDEYVAVDRGEISIRASLCRGILLCQSNASFRNVDEFEHSRPLQLSIDLGELFGRNSFRSGVWGIAAEPAGDYVIVNAVSEVVNTAFDRLVDGTWLPAPSLPGGYSCQPDSVCNSLLTEYPIVVDFTLYGIDADPFYYLGDPDQFPNDVICDCAAGNISYTAAWTEGVINTCRWDDAPVIDPWPCTSETAGGDFGGPTQPGLIYFGGTASGSDPALIDQRCVLAQISMQGGTYGKGWKKFVRPQWKPSDIIAIDPSEYQAKALRALMADDWDDPTDDYAARADLRASTNSPCSADPGDIKPDDNPCVNLIPGTTPIEPIQMQIQNVSGTGDSDINTIWPLTQLIHSPCIFHNTGKLKISDTDYPYTVKVEYQSDRVIISATFGDEADPGNFLCKFSYTNIIGTTFNGTAAVTGTFGADTFTNGLADASLAEFNGSAVDVVDQWPDPNLERAYVVVDGVTYEDSDYP